jgi:NADH-quinone oxidoreductase subunit N
VFVFAAAVQADYVWLAIIGVINSIIGLYYYLIVLKYVYLYRGPEDEERKPLPISRPYAIALTILTVGVILLGTLFGPWFELSSKITSGMF